MFVPVFEKNNNNKKKKNHQVKVFSWFSGNHVSPRCVQN